MFSNWFPEDEVPQPRAWSLSLAEEGGQVWVSRYSTGSVRTGLSFFSRAILPYFLLPAACREVKKGSDIINEVNERALSEPPLADSEPPVAVFEPGVAVFEPLAS